MLGEHGQPAVAGADSARRREQAQAFLARRQAGEALAGRVVVGDEQLLAVQHGRILGARVVAEVEVEPLQIRDDRAPQRRMRDAVEVIVGEIRHARAPAKELDERKPLDRAGELAAAAFVDAQHRRQVLDGGVMDVESVGQQLADAGIAARPVHGVLIAGGEQEGVCLGAAGPVRAEEGADIVSQFVRQRAEPGALRECREGQVDEDVGSPFLPNAIPAVGAGDPAEQRERAGYAAEALCQLRRCRELAVHGEATALGDERHEGLDQRLVVGDEFLTFLDAGDSPLPGDPVHRERLGVGLVAEHVEDARGRGDRAPSVSRLLDPLAKLFLREELLEGALPRHDPVALEIDGGIGCLPVEAGGDDQDLPGELPRRGEHDDALVGILDDVDDVAEIHDVGGRPLFVGEERRIPARHRNPHLVQPQQIAAAAATVVEERPLLVDQAVVERKRHGAGQRGPADGGGDRLAWCSSGSC